MVKIKLDKIEYAYLCKASFLPKNFHNLLSSLKREENIYLLILSEKEADEIRDLFGEQLQLAGFDESYKLTQEGAILESLIDKFFCG